MDAAELFRQAQSSVNRAREAKTLRREDSHESEEQSPRIAHTLTACCRCRQVRGARLLCCLFTLELIQQIEKDKMRRGPPSLSTMRARWRYL